MAEAPERPAACGIINNEVERPDVGRVAEGRLSACGLLETPHFAVMPWDLRGSLLKKEERESARLADFEFKLRARTFRHLAESMSVSPSEVLPLIAIGDDAAILRDLVGRFGVPAANLDASYNKCRSVARAQLIQEIGDPSPYRLA